MRLFTMLYAFLIEIIPPPKKLHSVVATAYVQVWHTYALAS